MPFDKTFGSLIQMDEFNHTLNNAFTKWYWKQDVDKRLDLDVSFSMMRFEGQSKYEYALSRGKWAPSLTDGLGVIVEYYKFVFSLLIKEVIK